MEVILFRHGIAADREDWKGDDADRPLTQEGIERTALAARGMGRLKMAPEVILSSPYARARKTAELVKEELGLDAKVEIIEDLTPEAAPDRLFNRLTAFPDKTSILCVGHEPHLSRTASAMISGKIAASIEMKKAGACCIGFAGSPKAGAGTLVWLLPSKVLRALAGK